MRTFQIRTLITIMKMIQMVRTPSFNIVQFGLIPKSVPKGPDNRIEDYSDDDDDENYCLVKCN
jgi:hypothetical protein